MLRTILTEDDADRVYDPLRIAFLVFVSQVGLGVFTFIGLAIYNASRFDPISFATGLAAIAAGGGALIGTTGAGLWVSSLQKKEGS